MPACTIDDCDLRHCTRCRACMPWHHAEATLCQSCECDIEAEETTTMPRFAPQPDDPAYDDETPEHVQKRMAELEKLARDLLDSYRTALTCGWRRVPADIERRACDLLDLDPPDFSGIIRGCSAPTPGDG